ncbi:synapsin-1-like [Macaca nemestrina]|uniref:synapsin-1-like n=1 Tax=Macaca nemestrina TaxID=9545 RepID=UPI0039B8940F
MRGGAGVSPRVWAPRTGRARGPQPTPASAPVSNLQEREDLAFSKLPKATQGPRGPGQPGRTREAKRAPAVSARHQPRRQFGLQKSQRRRRPPRGGPAPAHPTASPGPAESPLPSAPPVAPRGSRPLPPLRSDCLVREMPPSARGRGPRPEGTRRRARILPAPSRLAAALSRATESGALPARGRPARLTYQE